MASRKESGPVSITAMASTSGTLDSPVKQIQIEGLVSVGLGLRSCEINFGGERKRNRFPSVADVNAKLKCEHHHGGQITLMLSAFHTLSIVFNKSLFKVTYYKTV